MYEVKIGYIKDQDYGQGDDVIKDSFYLYCDHFHECINYAIAVLTQINQQNIKQNEIISIKKITNEGYRDGKMMTMRASITYI